MSQPPQLRAAEGKVRQDRLRAARPGSVPAAGTTSISQLGALQRGALGHQLERERRAPTARPGADARPSARRSPPGGRAACRSAIATTDWAIASSCTSPQQILGSGSPTSWSITRRPPNAVSTSTMPRRLGLDLADLGGALAARARSAARRAPSSAASGATNATSLPSLATYIGSMPSSSAAPATAGSTGHGRLVHDHRDAGRARQLVQHRGDAAAGRVAHAAQRRARRRRAARRPPATASRCRTRSRRRGRARRGPA